MKWISVGDKLIEVSGVKEISKEVVRYTGSNYSNYGIAIDGKIIYEGSDKDFRNHEFNQIKRELLEVVN